MITFPTTKEAFIEYQEAGIGRKLGGFERNLAALVVELTNISYQEGTEGRTHTVSMEDVETFFQERDREAAFHKLARIWEVSAGGVTWHIRPGRRQAHEQSTNVCRDHLHSQSELYRGILTPPPELRYSLREGA